MTRYPDWPERLEAAVGAARHRPFAWGEHDCSLWVADAVLAMTGVDLADLWRGTYHDEAGAKLVWSQAGRWPWILDRAACRHGLSRIGPATAGRGDIVLAKHNGQLQPTICVGDHLAAAGPDGLVFLPRAAGVGAWGV